MRIVDVVGAEEGLFLAKKTSRIRVVANALLSSTLDINAQNEFGQTAIFLATHNRYTCICEMLMAFGADPTIVGRNGFSALSISKSDPKIDSIINKKPSEKSEYQGSAEEIFFSAINNRDIRKIITILINCNVTINVNILNKDGKSALHLAVERGDMYLLEILHAFEADLNIKESLYSYTALSLAILNADLDMTKTLLRLGARQNIGDNFPIHIASERGNCEAIKLLLRQPDIEDVINAVDSNGFTPLHLAVKSNNISVVKELLTCCSVDVKDKTNGNTALRMVAKSHKNLDMIVTLLLHGADPNLKKCNEEDFFDFMSTEEIKKLKVTISLFGKIINSLPLTNSKRVAEPYNTLPLLKRGKFTNEKEPNEAFLKECDTVLRALLYPDKSSVYEKKYLTDTQNINLSKFCPKKFLVYSIHRILPPVFLDNALPDNEDSPPSSLSVDSSMPSFSPLISNISSPGYQMSPHEESRSVRSAPGKI